MKIRETISAAGKRRFKLKVSEGQLKLIHHLLGESTVAADKAVGLTGQKGYYLFSEIGEALEGNRAT